MYGVDNNLPAIHKWMKPTSLQPSFPEQGGEQQAFLELFHISTHVSCDQHVTQIRDMMPTAQEKRSISQDLLDQMKLLSIGHARLGSGMNKTSHACF